MDIASEAIPAHFLEANRASRAALNQGLKREKEKQAKLRSQFGDQAERLFQEWRAEQEQEEQTAAVVEQSVDQTAEEQANSRPVSKEEETKA